MIKSGSYHADGKTTKGRSGQVVKKNFNEKTQTQSSAKVALSVAKQGILPDGERVPSAE